MKHLQRILFLLCLLFSLSVQAEPPWHTQASRKLQQTFEDDNKQQPELSTPVISAFYQKRQYRLIWSDADGPLNRAYDLLQFITDADDEGLTPADYQLLKIRKIWDSRSLDEIIQLERLLSSALYHYSNHVYSGRFDPKELDADWHIRNQPLDSGKLFADVAKKESIKSLLSELPPQHSSYRLLKAGYKRLRDLEQRGGWQRLPAGPVLEAGMQHKQVLALKRRMLVTGDLSDNSLRDVDIFDHELTEAVKRYQSRHGIDADGRVGPQTRRSMNVTAAEKIRKIRINMERWRWLKRNLGRRYLVVNMTGFEIYLMENDTSVMTMPIIIGKRYRATPTFSGWVSTMEYNPYWTIPKTIAVEDILPKLVRNPAYLTKRSIKLYRGWANAIEIDPQTVDWSKIDKDNFPYWMRQEPGPQNALGRVKFLFSNPYDIYLHGTPDKHLFDRTVRAFSSGCIRIKDPVRLAAYLLDDGSQQMEEEVLANIHLGNNQKISLKISVPIYLVYLTAWADQDGKINFRDDIYGRDTLLNQAFSK